MEEKYLVIGNKNFDNETIYYCGDTEILAFKRFKELPSNMMKIIVKAKVEFVMLHGYEFIKDYEIIEEIT